QQGCGDGDGRRFDQECLQPVDRNRSALRELWAKLQRGVAEGRVERGVDQDRCQEPGDQPKERDVERRKAGGGVTRQRVVARRVERDRVRESAGEDRVALDGGGSKRRQVATGARRDLRNRRRGACARQGYTEGGEPEGLPESNRGRRRGCDAGGANTGRE